MTNGGGSACFRMKTGRRGGRTRPDDGHARRLAAMIVGRGTTGVASVVAAKDGLVSLSDVGDLRAETHVYFVHPAVS